MSSSSPNQGVLAQAWNWFRKLPPLGKVIICGSVGFMLVALAINISSRTGDDTYDGPPISSSTVTVPVVKQSSITDYATRDTARVGVGGVSIDAMSTREPCGVDKACDGSNRHYLHGKLYMKDGSSVDCAERRMTIWSADQQYESISMPCDRAINLDQVEKFVF